MRNFFRKLMYGRYGYDQLNLFLLSLCLICWILCTFLKNTTVSSILSVLGYVLILFSLFRSFSRNSRPAAQRGITNSSPSLTPHPPVRQMRAQTCDREHKYFRCPNCGQMLRVPKGKGKFPSPAATAAPPFQKKT